MKRLFLIVILLASITFCPMKAQDNNFLNISVDAGFITNTKHDKKFGLGGTLAWLTQDNLLSLNPDNYITLSVKAFNNPYGDGKFISSILNNANDAFNYIMPLAGYRVTWGGVSNGFFVEPRLGVVFGSSYTGMAFSPMAGYTVQRFNFSLYCDMGIGGKENANHKKNFFTPGLSIGYNISIN